MGETGRDEHLAEVVAGELGARPLAEGGRARSDVHRDVEDLALQRPDQLALGPLHLRVQSPERAAVRARLVVLDERVRDARFAVLSLVERLQEMTAGIAEDVRLDEQDAREIGIQYTHWRRFTFRIGSRGRAP